MHLESETSLVRQKNIKEKNAQIVSAGRKTFQTRPREQTFPLRVAIVKNQFGATAYRCKAASANLKLRMIADCQNIVHRGSISIRWEQNYTPRSEGTISYQPDEIKKSANKRANRPGPAV